MQILEALKTLKEFGLKVKTLQAGVSTVTEPTAKPNPFIERIGTSGDEVLLIHGGVQGNIGGGPASFIKQRSLAEQGWRLALLERPGFGRSPSWGVDDMARDAEWLANSLDRPVHLVGHSWGGALALLTAANNPKVISSLTMIEPAMQSATVMNSLLRFDGRSARSIVESFRPMLAAGDVADFARAFVKTVVDPRLAPMNQEMAERLGVSFLKSRLASPLALLRAAQTVRRNKIPTLVISGGWNPSLDTVCKITSRLCIGGYIVVPSPNHFPQLENPIVFNSVLVDFFKKSKSR